MSFVVDGAEWQFEGHDPDDIDLLLGRLLERAEVARSRGEKVWVGDDLQYRHVLGDLDIWRLWSPDSPVRLSSELKHELAALLMAAPRYLDEESWPDGMDHTALLIGGDRPVDNPDVAWAHHHVRAGRAVACLGMARSGVHETRSSLGMASLHWVTNETQHRAFFRAALDVERDTEENIERLAPHAWPDLCFLPRVWRELGDFQGGYARVRKDLRRHLSHYDDHGAWAFTASPPAELQGEPVPSDGGSPSNGLIERRFALMGIDVAPEKPEVHRNATCRTARERVLGNRTIYCEWHGKLEPHVNRVHLHGPVPESGGRLVVAIFHEHLPLPGDR